ncbi:MAG: haloacid dehalogenase type II [Alphaproteobacteria bacterium]|nr:haloacid dehalogenase type II [Alphaproteobacteria bacterium]
MKLTDYAALSFDCYGTLIDWESGILAEIRPWLARYRQERSDDAILEAYGVVEAECEHRTPSRLYRDLLVDVHVALAKRWGLPADAAAARRFGDSVPRWPAFPDSAAALAKLKKRFKLIILSNVDRRSFAGSNKRLGVTFDAICTAEDIGSYKPDPRNFAYVKKAVAALGVPADKHLHVAQSLFHDIAPANAAGLPSAWINRRRGKPGGGATPPASATPSLEVGSMAEFAALLD